MARGAADAASQTAPRLRRIRNTPPEAFRAIPAHTNNPIAGAQNGASASVQDTNPVQMIPEQKQGNAYERTA